MEIFFTERNKLNDFRVSRHSLEKYKIIFLIDVSLGVAASVT